MKQFLRFCVVGAIGFVTLGGRLISFLVAATVTWKVNRHFTFVKKEAGSIREWLQYLMFTGVGGLINVAVYQSWLWLSGDHGTLNLFLAVVAGSGVAMICNFMISKYAVFNERHSPS